VLTFEEYVTENIAATRQPKPTIVPATLLDSMKTAGLLPATLPGEPSMVEVAASLLAKVSNLHHLQVADPAASRAEKRITLQNVGNAFLTVLTMAGSFPEESSKP
jgi:hypothetical protein